jgi:hypothetical protein
MLLLLPSLLLGGQALRSHLATAPLMPGLQPDEVARIELARGREQVVLARRADTGAWEILSAADAPADAARIARTLAELKALRGPPIPAGTPPPRAEALELRLSDARGETLGAAGFWSDQAAARPPGPRIALARPPALPLWQSAWSTLGPPPIPVERIAAIERLTPEGPVLLDSGQTGAAATLLAGLGPKDFVAGAGVSWAGSNLYRVRLTDGQAIDIQQVPDGEGRWHLRFTSDTLTEIRAIRRFAYRSERALP